MTEARIDIDRLRAELEANRQERERELNRWPLRWLGPENGIALRLTLGCAACCYIAGFLWGATWFAFAFALAMICWPMWEERHKYLREQRLSRYRAGMEAWERGIREAWARQRIIITTLPGHE